MTDKQWTLIEPLPAPTTDGRPEKHPRREIVNALFSVLRTGCSWRQLPHDLPPWQTVYWYFKRWRDDGTVDRVHDALRGCVAWPVEAGGSCCPSTCAPAGVCSMAV